MVKGLSMSIGFSPKECAKALISAENILSFSNSFVVRKIIDFFSRIPNWIALQFLKIQRNVIDTGRGAVSHKKNCSLPRG
jgi:hypothetical protein